MSVELFSYLTSLILNIDCPVRNDADEEEYDDECEVPSRQTVPGGRLQHLAQLRLPPAVLPGAAGVRFNIQWTFLLCRNLSQIMLEALRLE